MLLRTAYVLAFSAALCRLLAGCGPHDDWAGQQEYVAQTEYASIESAASQQGIRPAGANGKFCLTADQSLGAGSPVRLQPCDGSDEQSFRLDGNALKVLANRCVRPGHGHDNNGAVLRVYVCDSDRTSQTWRRENNTLHWSSSDKCLDVIDGELKGGTQLQLWTCDPANVNQQFLFAGQAAAPAPAHETQPAAAQPQGTKFDLSKWRQETYAKGTFNNEEERYTNGNRNVSFHANGETVITARKENGEWTSARLTGDEVGELPAYYEASITLPSAKGTWPAFWLTSRGSWPQGGEIDIMEQVNGDGKTHWSNHWGAHSGKATFNTHESLSGLDLSKPHTYGGYLTEKGVQFYVDGKAVGKFVSYPAEANWGSIARKMVPIVNLAMGGNWPGNIPGNVGAQTMTVHWVTKSKAPAKF